MPGFCFSIDYTKEQLISELSSHDFKSLKNLDLLNESTIGSEFISPEMYEVIKTSINDKDLTRLFMMNPINKQKLWELALIKTKMWKSYDKLDVFIIPHAFGSLLNEKIKTFANMWTPHCGIKFNFSNKLPAEITIQINANGVNSSLIGIESLGKTPSMHLGVGNATDIKIQRAVLHEFGHALGCIHEHQAPTSGIQWDKPAVIRACALERWTPQMVQHNIFNKYNSDITNSRFDPDSIMIYPIPAYFTTNGYSVSWNTVLSSTDKTFINKAYSLI
ncbi:MAG: hypothetical protein C0594_04485 [Marinilabiliales bacterium]|nr:MAG: hypothetical protein C0594_04485 [Marinilabiliales bacterium]